MALRSARRSHRSSRMTSKCFSGRDRRWTMSSSESGIGVRLGRPRGGGVAGWVGLRPAPSWAMQMGWMKPHNDFGMTPNCRPHRLHPSRLQPSCRNVTSSRQPQYARDGAQTKTPTTALQHTVRTQKTKTHPKDVSDARTARTQPRTDSGSRSGERDATHTHTHTHTFTRDTRRDDDARQPVQTLRSALRRHERNWCEVLRPVALHKIKHRHLPCRRTKAGPAVGSRRKRDVPLSRRERE